MNAEQTPASRQPVTHPPERFVPVPTWALRKALDDHKARCSACSGVEPAECIDAWYRRGLEDWLAKGGIGERR